MSGRSFSQNVFKAIDTLNQGFVVKSQVLQMINNQGCQNHRDLKKLINYLNECFDEEPISEEQIEQFIVQNTFFKQILESDLVIPDFMTFQKKMIQIYNQLKNEEFSGQMLQPLSKLSNRDEQMFGFGFASVDGQTFNIGEFRQKFHISQIGKVVAYVYCYELIGEDIHKWVGEESSGQQRDAPIFDSQGLPHNPLIDSGAILICCLIIQQNKNINDIIKFYKTITQMKKIEIDFELVNQKQIQSTSDYTLMNLMLAKNKLPTYDSHELNMEKALEAMKLYHSIESILVEVESLALFGACLANNGIAPLTNEKIISDKAISAINPMIMTCGMSVRVGQFVEAYGLPAVYGTCGNLLSIVPGVGALVSISPITDEYSVSLRGQALIKKVSESWSDFNILFKDASKSSLRDFFFQKELDEMISARKAVYFGDLDMLQRLKWAGLNVNDQDYDGTTLLHMAVSQGFKKIVKFLVKEGADINKTDRWGQTPLNYCKSKHINAFLLHNSALKGEQAIQNQYLRLNENDNFYRTMIAIQQNRIEILQLLRISGWVVNDFDHNGRTPLHLAASLGNLDIFNFLINNQANIDSVDNRGNNALTDAVRENRTDIIERIYTLYPEKY